GIVATRISRKIQETVAPPLISLRVSRIASISVWTIIVVGFLIGILSGLLGVGGGFIITPAFIYLFGVPTTVAVGTGLFQIIFTSGYGAFTHFFKGNVDFTLVAGILAGSLVGSQFGAMLNKRLRGAYVRYYFSWVVFIAIGIIILKFLYNLGYFD
ncbi:MAG: sulfite exporter TauE/SafE family protein, partial [bacterium]